MSFLPQKFEITLSSLQLLHQLLSSPLAQTWRNFLPGQLLSKIMGGRNGRRVKTFHFENIYIISTNQKYSFGCNAQFDTYHAYETIFSEETDGQKILFARNTSSSPLNFFSYGVSSYCSVRQNSFCSIFGSIFIP